jgi:hypothetical protein
VKFETRHLVTYQETIFFTLPASLEYLVVGLAERATGKAEDVVALPSPGGEGQDKGERHPFPKQISATLG